MPKITLENGKEIIISQESYDAMCKAVQEPLRYDDIAKKLFPENSRGYYIKDNGKIGELQNNGYICKASMEINNATTKEQLEALLCLNMWLNVAEYLNQGWKPDWENWVDKYRVSYDQKKFLVETNQINIVTLGPWFKSKELALKSVDILGEETCKKALGIYKI